MALHSLPLNRRGIRVSRRLLVFLTVGVALLLILGCLQSEALADDTKATKPSDSKTVSARPDRVSAMSTAIEQKSKVEDLSARTASSSTFANPDGTWTTKSTAGATRTQDADGKWVDLNSDVAKSGGEFAPQASPYDLSFSDGGDKTVASANSPSGDTVGVGWPSQLPAPAVDGDTLTYPNAADGSDLVVTSLPDGFDYSIVLDKAPDPAADPLEFRVPLNVSGAKATVNDDGSVSVKDGKKLIAAMSAPVMWDGAKANKDGTGDTSPVTTTVDDTAATPTLILKPNMKFLTDPATTYPVTVDPTVTLTVAGDTFVQSSGTTSSQFWLPDLHVGSNDGGTTVARSYMYFDASGWSGLTSARVTSARLDLSNFETGSCTGSPVTMSEITSSWNGATIAWATQPTVTSAHAASSSQSFGATGCATEGLVSFDATQIVKDWVGGAANWGVRISADNETAASGWRRFRSQEAVAPAPIPTLTLTYDSSPHDPTATAVEPALTSGSNQVTSSQTPSFSSVLSDPDGGQVTGHFKLMQGSTVVDSADVGPVPSGSRVNHSPSAAVPDGTYTAQWQADDGMTTSAWSPAVTVVVDHIPPAAPTVSCSSTAPDTWYDTQPAAYTDCHITGSTGTTAVSATLNGALVAGLDPLSGGTTSKSFPVPTDGMFNLKVVAYDAAANAVTKSYSFGVGTGALTSPKPGARSTRSFTINATSKSGAASAQAQWRLAGNTTWTTAHVMQGLIPWPGFPSNVGTTSVTGDLTWNAADETGMISPSLVDVRFCFNYSGGTQRCTAVSQVNLGSHAFGGSYPTADVGPADVSLQTGEFQVEADDVSVPGFGDDLGLSRTYQSFGSTVPVAQGVFGGGWVANLYGNSEGFAGAQVIDRTSTNGTISLLDSDGSSSTYKFSSGGHTAQATGIYKGQGEAAGNNEKLELKSGSPKTLVLTESDGTVTTWSYAGSNTWNVTSTHDATATPATTYAYTADNLMSGIYDGVPGVTCNSTTQNRGCHALLMTYTTVGSNKRLSQVDLKTWDPAASSGAGAMTTTTVEKYSYDASGRLIGEYDPREDTTSGHLTTTYTYQTVATKSYLASAQPPAQKAWNFNLNTDGTLDTVTRDQDSAVGGTATWHVVYGVGLSGSGLPDLTSAGVGRWAQAVGPDNATAVFGPDAPNTTDMTYADITYFTQNGQTTNTASYGAGAWQIDSHAYDQFGNEIWSLNPTALNAGLKNNFDSGALGALLSTRTTYNATGDRVESVVGPMNNLMLENGTGLSDAHRIDMIYDDEAAAESVPVPGRPTPSANPDDPKPNILVEQRDYVTSWDGWEYHPGAAPIDLHKTRYRYDKVVSTDGDGWAQHSPTRTSVDLGSGWSTSLTRFDTYGQTIETRTPQGVSTTDGAGSDAKSTINTYFTADASSAVVACRNHPEWLGLVCQSGPVASTGDDPTTTTTAFDYLQNPTVTTETSAPMTRITTDAYDADGRITNESVAMSGAPAGDKPVAATTYTYSPTDGSLQSESTSAGSVARTFDSWGRTLTMTDGAGNTGSETFDAAGRVKTVNDGKGTYNYTYDGTDSNGKTERRGLVTKVDVGLAAGPDEFTASYGADGNATQVRYPNDVVQDNVYDILGNQTTQTYSRNGTTIMSENAFLDVHGRTRVDLTAAASKAFTYDGRGRLTSVQDYSGGPCTTRTYTYSLDSDRISLASSPWATDGSCSTSSPTTKSNTFAADDRITNVGYAYDAFGRAQTAPATDTDQPNGGALSVDYYANDMVAHLAQNSPTSISPLLEKTYTLDPLQRIAMTTSAMGGVDLAKSTNHFSGISDSPAWTDDQSRPDATTAWSSSWTRFVRGLGGLGMIQKSDGTSRIQLTNMHGDVVSTMANTTSTSTALENYTDSTEFGAAEALYPRIPGQQYSWLGAQQRSTNTLGGLTLMGARLYNSATGTFLSQDSVLGGNDNPYDYPADPINNFDATGLQVLQSDGAPPTYRPSKSHPNPWRTPRRTVVKRKTSKASSTSTRSSGTKYDSKSTATSQCSTGQKYICSGITIPEHFAAGGPALNTDITGACLKAVGNTAFFAAGIGELKVVGGGLRASWRATSLGGKGALLWGGGWLVPDLGACGR